MTSGPFSVLAIVINRFPFADILEERQMAVEDHHSVGADFRDCSPSSLAVPPIYVPRHGFRVFDPAPGIKTVSTRRHIYHILSKTMSQFCGSDMPPIALLTAFTTALSQGLLVHRAYHRQSLACSSNPKLTENTQ